MSDPLREAAVLAGASWPYRTAAQLLKKLCGAHISREEIRRLANEHGNQRAEQQQTEAEQACACCREQVPSAVPVEQPMLVGLDGGWVCSREQRGGMEGKVAVVCSQVEDLPMPASCTTFSWSDRSGRRRPPRPRHRLARRRSVATFAPSRELGKLAEAAARSLGEQERTRPVVVLADGAQWIKKEQERHFPQATCILDWAHLWREVRHAIQTAARARPLSARERDDQRYLHRCWLWQGEWIKP
ncbi:MAG: transposase [Ktedonobacteraceae bacterium]|nr:transposase [Ktedonobacteraceae bacterium]